jgi:hypothetical protein
MLDDGIVVAALNVMAQIHCTGTVYFTLIKIEHSDGTTSSTCTAIVDYQKTFLTRKSSIPISAP